MYNRRESGGQEIAGRNRKEDPRPGPDRVDYSTYRLTAREWLLYGALRVGKCGLASYVLPQWRCSHPSIAGARYLIKEGAFEEGELYS